MRNYLLLAVHIILGSLAANIQNLSTFWILSTLFYFLFQTIRHRNGAEQALIGSAYIASAEVWVRMTKANVPWEFSKFAILVLLFSGLLVERPKSYNYRILLLFVLLIPGTLISWYSAADFEQFRQNFTFQVGGVMVLVLALFYCYKRITTFDTLNQVFRATVLPVVATTTHLFIKTPALADIKFNLAASFTGSGGYGPNQVSTILGLGVFVIALSKLFKLAPIFSKQVDLFVLVVILYRALITLSRGGLATMFLCMVLTYVIYLTFERKWNVQRAFSLIGIVLVMGIAAYFVNNLTGNALIGRFQGQTDATSGGFEERSIDKATSGRSEIVMTDLHMFLDYPIFGVGIGVSNEIRPDYGYNNISHIEQTRLLAEHGTLGILFLLVMIFLPVFTFITRKGHNKYFLFAFSLFASLTMLHSATRLAEVGLYYGIAFMLFFIEDYTLHRQPA